MSLGQGMFRYKQFDIKSEVQFNVIKKLIDNDLSEPYSIYVYRYFLNQWPSLAYLAYDPAADEENAEPIGCIVCKAETHLNVRQRGYIAMLAVNNGYRGRGIAKKLVTLAIEEMIRQGCDEIMLETECSNEVALHLYESMGFLRLKRMFRYYLNQGDAFKLILPINKKSCIRSTFLGTQI
ncbi:peptide alpha-N-acetyltransferase MAK3 Ecym_7457 [Eremothecium cymbalariae DBVPG|uniref:N-acetyltransferase domain-containing protein n=1 Tax=Eremothecium cymbalariae (strain CBS 270.75 / DBVPG 7215 / KCTC 17166 / NRRL Y-17582) TaxID=931890 RepID=G8JWR1_ERECY|nr:hypothetical protein Ecym_7457 [Eremothecium cymbalariae DBVPG\